MAETFAEAYCSILWAAITSTQLNEKDHPNSAAFV
jgi:hypothetical protein